MTLSFKGHIVVITGAGGGLGRMYVRSQRSFTLSADTRVTAMPSSMLLVGQMSWSMILTQKLHKRLSIRLRRVRRFVLILCPVNRMLSNSSWWKCSSKFVICNRRRCSHQDCCRCLWWCYHPYQQCRYLEGQGVSIQNTYWT